MVRMIRAHRAGAAATPSWLWSSVRIAATVSAQLGELGVGRVTGISVTWRDASGRIREAAVSGTRGSAT